MRRPLLLPPSTSAVRASAGFTLLEVMVALVVSALVLLGARALLEQVGDVGEAVAGSAAEVDAAANAERRMRAWLARAEVPFDTAADARNEFVGTAEGARFVTWCEVPDGWLERCRASLGLLSVDGANVLALSADGGEVVPVRRGFAEGKLLYLIDPGMGGTWLPAWESDVSPPYAVGVVLDADTLILRIGDRG